MRRKLEDWLFSGGRRAQRKALSNEQIAQLFHETYEHLAPNFNYETRKESAVPWDDVPENNRKLMVAVVGRVRAVLEGKREPEKVALNPGDMFSPIDKPTYK